MTSSSYIFGGTFDPIHEGHIGVIRELLAKNKQVVIAPTESNPLKASPSSSFEIRLEMIRKVLKYEKISFSEKTLENVFLSTFKYRYVCDFVEWFKSTHSEKIVWVIGPDLVSQVNTWKHWDKMKLEVYVSSNYADNLHSSDIRNSIKPIHPALR